MEPSLYFLQLTEETLLNDDVAAFHSSREKVTQYEEFPSKLVFDCVKI